MDAQAKMGNMPTAAVSDTFLYYRSVGAGPPCVVMHGGLGIDHDAYSPGLDALGGAMKLVYYDHRCHGRFGGRTQRPSPWPVSPTTPMSCAKR